MATADWTWMIYLATHNDLEYAGEQSLARLNQPHIDARVQVLIQEATVERSIRYGRGANPQIIQNLGQLDSGEPATLSDFIRWAATTAPAQRYALVLWSHGSGWEPGEMARIAQQQPAAVPVTSTELVQRGADDGHHVFFSSTMRTLLSQPTPPDRAIAFDDGSGHSLDTIELGQVMASAVQILGQPVDLLGMNACLMNTVEIAYQVRNQVSVYVASEDLMPSQSWPYDDIFTRLSAQPEMDAIAVGKMIVERYCAFFRTPPQAVTLAALRLAGIESLAKAVSTLADTLQTNIDNQLPAIWAAHRAAHGFQFRLYDLASFCQALMAQSIASSASIVAAQQVLRCLVDSTFLLASDHTDHSYDNTGGTTTYLMPPAPGKKLSPYYAETTYAQATGWGNFLAAYHIAAQ